MCLPAVLGAAGGLGTAAAASSTALSIQGLSAGIGAVSKVAGVMATNKAAKQNAQSGGVQGRDIDKLINDFERSEGMMASRIDLKLEAMSDQVAAENLGFQSEAENRINSQQPIGFAESLFKVADPLMSFGVDVFDRKARYAALEGKA